MSPGGTQTRDTVEFAPNQAIRVPYPFIRETVTLHDGEGPYDAQTWRPGTRIEKTAPGDYGNVADGNGSMLLLVVSVHKPGRFPTRVFYTRKWQDPSGRVFGKTDLRVCTLEKFRRISREYQHYYALASAESEAA